MTDSLKELSRRLDAFAAERDWLRHHAPKNLASALIVEAAELLEHFQWISEEQSRVLSSSKRDEVAAEMADVLIYLVQLANVMDVDLVEAARKKMQVNESRFPVPER
ncbi:MAG: nucleotide pyrophosphohydrolase [Burkholderiaceae bacterium]